MSLFVGRDAELGLLGRSLARAGESRSPTVVAVEGEPGIGKTALLDQFAGGRSDTLVVRVDHRDEEWRPPYDTLARLLLELEGRIGSARFERILSRPARLAALVPELADGAGASTEGPELAQEVAGVLLRAARLAPVLIVVDDWHMADSASVTLLRALLPRISGERLLLLLAARFGAPPPGDRERVERVVLGGLGHDQMAELAVAVRGEPVDSAWAIALTEYTGGNPLLATSLLRCALRSSGAARPAELPLPPDLSRHVRDRLRHLSEPARRLVLGAAVLPSEISIARAMRVGGVVEDRDAVLEEATSSGLIARKGSTLWLRAPVLGRAALESLSPRRRRQLLQRVRPPHPA